MRPTYLTRSIAVTVFVHALTITSSATTVVDYATSEVHVFMGGTTLVDVTASDPYAIQSGPYQGSGFGSHNSVAPDPGETFSGTGFARVHVGDGLVGSYSNADATGVVQKQSEPGTGTLFVTTTASWGRNASTGSMYDQIILRPLTVSPSDPVYLGADASFHLMGELSWDRGFNGIARAAVKVAGVINDTISIGGPLYYLNGDPNEPIVDPTSPFSYAQDYISKVYDANITFQKVGDEYVSSSWGITLTTSASVSLTNYGNPNLMTVVADAGSGFNQTLSFDSLKLADGHTPEADGYQVIFASGLASPNLQLVPEPSSLIIASAGVPVGLAYWWRRRRIEVATIPRPRREFFPTRWAVLFPLSSIRSHKLELTRPGSLSSGAGRGRPFR